MSFDVAGSASSSSGADRAPARPRCLPLDDLWDLLLKSRSRTVRLRAETHTLVADARRECVRALAARLASRPASHYAHLAGEVGGAPVNALVRHSGAADGDRSWLRRAGLSSDAHGATNLGGSLGGTLALSRSCTRLLDLRFVDIGRAYAPVAGGCQAMTNEGIVPFSMEVSDDGDVHQVRLVGEVDIAVSGCLRERLVDLAGSTVDVDLSGLTFLDASGISALVTARRQVLADGHGFRLHGASGIVRRVFELTDLGQILDDG